MSWNSSEQTKDLSVITASVIIRLWHILQYSSLVAFLKEIYSFFYHTIVFEDEWGTADITRGWYQIDIGRGEAETDIRNIQQGTRYLMRFKTLEGFLNRVPGLDVSCSPRSSEKNSIILD